MAEKCTCCGREIERQGSEEVYERVVVPVAEEGPTVERCVYCSSLCKVKALVDSHWFMYGDKEAVYEHLVALHEVRREDIESYERQIVPYSKDKGQKYEDVLGSSVWVPFYGEFHSWE